MATLAEELPYAAVVATDKLPITCHTCFTSKEDKTLSRCTRCRVIHYCGRDCQKKDWLEHKYECMFLEKCAPRVPTSMARLISRIAMKMARNDEKEALNGRTIDVLMDNHEHINKDPERSEFFVCISHVLFEYMGTQFVPKPAVLMSIFGKIVTNCFTITDDSMATLGEGIYVGLSAHDHSCAPDCYVLFDGAKAILRTPHRGKRYDTNLTISYTDLMQSNKERKRALKAQYYFDCNCSVCQDSTRDEWCRSAAADCCPEGLCLLDERKMNLVCYKCGTVSKLEVDDVIAANQELNMLLDGNGGRRKNDPSERSLNDCLQTTIATYERLRKILSPLNSGLAQYSQRILNYALDLDQKSIAIKYALVGVEAYKRYLPVGHPELALRLQLAAICKSFEETPTGVVLELLQEAYSSALLSHGPRHSLTSTIDHMLSSYRIRLQRDVNAS